MPKKYTKSETLNLLADALKKIDTLYQQRIVNYAGETIDTKELYSEVIAEALLSQFEQFKNITTITRKSSYKTESHKGTTPNPTSNRKEERLALSMFGKTYDQIGKILDYQVPLKDSRSNKAGKIDLLSNHNGELMLLELKGAKNNETLLRCVLEVATYYYIVDKEKLCKDFGFPETTIIKKAVLVPSTGTQHEEYKNIKTNIRELMLKLDVGIFLFKVDKVSIMRPDGD